MTDLNTSYYTIHFWTERNGKDPVIRKVIVTSKDMKAAEQLAERYVASQSRGSSHGRLIGVFPYKA